MQNEIVCPAPVSYTHLDVYKRQVLVVYMWTILLRVLRYSLFIYDVPVKESVTLGISHSLVWFLIMLRVNTVTERSVYSTIEDHSFQFVTLYL